MNHLRFRHPEYKWNKNHNTFCGLDDSKAMLSSYLLKVVSTGALIYEPIVDCDVCMLYAFSLGATKDTKEWQFIGNYPDSDILTGKLVPLEEAPK